LHKSKAAGQARRFEVYRRSEPFSLVVAEQVAVGALGDRLLDIRVRLLDRSGVRGVDRSGRLVGVGRAVIVGARRSRARGNEQGGGGKSNLVHSGYSRFSKVVSVKWRAVVEIRVARTTPRWVGLVALSNHENVQIEPNSSTLKSREQWGCHIFIV